jgi:hypothetical protein
MKCPKENNKEVKMKNKAWQDLMGMVKAFLLAIKKDWGEVEEVSMRKSNSYQEPPTPTFSRIIIRKDKI